MDITINYDYGRERVEGMPLESLAQFIIAAEGKPASTEVSISFVDDDRIAELNEAYRGKVGPTDVLSFECDGYDDDFNTHNEADQVGEIPYELGDIVVAVDVAERQTTLFGTTLAEEIELLVCHGLLHLCGYDHMVEEEAQVMEAREDELLAAWRNSL